MLKHPCENVVDNRGGSMSPTWFTLKEMEDILFETKYIGLWFAAIRWKITLVRKLTEYKLIQAPIFKRNIFVRKTIKVLKRKSIFNARKSIIYDYVGRRSQNKYTFYERATKNTPTKHRKPFAVPTKTLSSTSVNFSNVVPTQRWTRPFLSSGIGHIGENETQNMKLYIAIKYNYSLENTN